MIAFSPLPERPRGRSIRLISTAILVVPAGCSILPLVMIAIKPLFRAQYPSSCDPCRNPSGIHPTSFCLSRDDKIQSIVH